MIIKCAGEDHSNVDKPVSTASDHTTDQYVTYHDGYKYYLNICIN